MTKAFENTRLLCRLLLAGSMLATAQAHAADAPAAPPAADNAPETKDIVVTAQRRRESVQNISIAVTALSGDALAEKQVARMLDLQNAAPGLSIVKSGLTESINIRGIGLASGSPQVTNGVSTYLDGVFQPPIVSTSQFYDVAGVEVLRGPQGTLVGANSTGGAIYINSAKPELGKFGGNATVGYGNYANLSANAAVNIPIGSDLAIRIAGLADRRDSYYKDLGPAHTAPDSLNERDLRAQALWKVGGFSALAKVELINKRTGGYAYQPIAGTQYAAGRTTIPWTVAYDTPTDNFERGTLTSLELKYAFDGGLTLRSLTGYLNKRVNNLYDNDGSDLAITAATPQVTQAQYVREREYSEELNIISPDNGVFKYVLGAYAQRNKINVRIVQDTTKPSGTSPLWIEPDTDKLLLGLFGQASYQITPKLQIEAGARYSHFHVDGTGGVYVARGAPQFGPLGLDVAPQTGTEGDGRATGKIALNYKPDANNLIYGFVARGYKNGGINPPGGTFAPETVWDYEAGWKSTLMDRHLRTQIGAFYNAYSNFQEDVTNPLSGQSGVSNIAKAKIWGFEASAQGHYGPLSLDGAVAYTHSSLSSFSVINREVTPAGISLPQCASGVANSSTCYNYAYVTTTGGLPNLYSPKWTWNVNAAYRIPVNDGVTVTPRVGYAYVGSQWAYVVYNPVTDLIKAHGLVNASVAIARDSLTFEVYGTNLAKSFYVAGHSGNNELYGAPREYGVRLSTKF